MLIDWINVTRISIRGADRLYPNDIDWRLNRGINAIIGGTGLGKTTLIYALQFAIFGKMVVDASERIEREFFLHRLTKRKGKNLEKKAPSVYVEFTVGSMEFAVTRLLLAGTLQEVVCDGALVSPKRFEKILSEQVGLKDDFSGLVRLQGHLFFFGEGRFLLSWQNQLQHELLSLLMSDHATYLKLGEIWEKAKSADSTARNLSAQAVRMERDLQKLLQQESSVKKLQQRSDADQIAERQKDCEEQLGLIRRHIANEEKIEKALGKKIADAYSEFHTKLSDIEESQSHDLDDSLFAAALADPTIASVRQALEEFYRAPNDRGCPCCGRPGISKSVFHFARKAAERAQKGSCVVCSRSLPKTDSRTTIVSRDSAEMDACAESLQSLLFQREQNRSRIAELKTEESRALQALAEAREAALEHAQCDPRSATEPIRIAIDQMRDREQKARKARDKDLEILYLEMSRTNAVFENIHTEIVAAFKKYASLYLDEPCDVEFLLKDQLPSKRGPQIKAPHSAFFPVVSGETRPSALALSDAQRSFIDLAFRMAVIEVWHQKTKNTVTMVIETPEGAVDIAYMERVATMMRTFGEQGHTLIITTNLNNNIFLPELMARWPKKQRRKHILNLLVEGSPRQVQVKHKKHFDDILNKVDSHTQTS